MRENIDRIEALFLRALELRPEERPAFLAGACGQERTLLDRVQALLQAHEAGEGILPERPRSEPPGGVIAEKPGDTIGHYKLLERIGEGGCGVVYMAEQVEPVRRLVALKIIKLGMDTRNVVARFEAERQALALMDHPNIARVLDAGTTGTGRPYFVMELVRGIKITDYCEQHNLSTPQRLELVVQACRAIQHAHQKGIIHRDIKPSNVLVTSHDGVGVLKVIDFGIAKATEGRLTDQTLFTAFEQFIGTPAYMSPEQAQLKGLDVDTRTDIYSLGVLLYELLTGRTPFDAKELLLVGLDEMRRTIQEKEPLRPSSRLTLELTRAGAAKQRGEALQQDAKPADRDPEKGETSHAGLARNKELIHVLRGDLDWIVMKCLEKDRTRRYETANGLAMDLQRHLTGEPVIARPPSNLYRFQKLVQRNKLAFSAATAVAVALVLGIVGSTWEAIRARRAERDQGRLRGEAEQARAGEAKQRTTAEQHLYDALLGEARAKQLSGRAGHRFESLEAISKAAAIRRSIELSDAAVAAFALPDLRPQKSWHFSSHWALENLCFDDSFKLFAQQTRSGISVRRIADDQETILLPLKPAEAGDDFILRRFDSSSRYLAASSATRDGREYCRVWDLARGAVILTLDGGADPDFSPDGRTIAVVNPDETVSIKELESGRVLKRFRVEGQPDMLRFSPDGQRLASLQFDVSVSIWNLSSGQVMATLVAPGKPTFLAWNHNGTLLATGNEDGEINIWDAQLGRLRTRLEGHQRRVARLAFSHQGDLLASGAWDHTLRLWDVASGQQLVVYRTPDTDLHFSPDDSTLAYAVSGETALLLEVAHSTGYRRLTGGPEPANWRMGDLSPDGRLVAIGTLVGIQIWDMVAGREIGLIPTTECRAALFQTDTNGGLSLIGGNSGGLFRWPLSTESTAKGTFLRVGGPATLASQASFGYLALDRSGRKILAARTDSGDPLVLDLGHRDKVVRLRGHAGAGFVAMDPGGRWATKSIWKGAGVNVYETSTGQLVGKLPLKRTGFMAFSPDEKWLAAADMMELRVWKTGSWEPLPPSLAGDQVSEINPLAFSPDGRLLAAAHGSYYEVKIMKVPSLEVISTLRAPNLASLTWVSFTPEGDKLVASEWSGQLDIWDLRRTRQELQKLTLDWDLPPFPPAREAPLPGPPVLQLDAAPFSQLELAKVIPPRAANTGANLIDLTDYYDAPLTQSWHSPKEAQNSLGELQSGVQNLNGVDFDVRGLIQVGAFAANGLAYPSRVEGIPVGQLCHRLHFLHSAIFAGGAHTGDELGTYLIHYIGGRQIEIPISAGKDVVDWWSLPGKQDATCVTAWTGSNPAAKRVGRTIRLFQTTWENPFPAVPINQLDFVSDKPAPGRPFLLAVTAEP